MTLQQARAAYRSVHDSLASALRLGAKPALIAELRVRDEAAHSAIALAAWCEGR